MEEITLREVKRALYLQGTGQPTGHQIRICKSSDELVRILVAQRKRQGYPATPDHAVLPIVEMLRRMDANTQVEFLFSLPDGMLLDVCIQVAIDALTVSGSA